MDQADRVELGLGRKPVESNSAALRTMVSSTDGGRALKYMKQREKARAELEKARENIDAEREKRKFKSIATMSKSQADVLEAQFSTETIGLVSKEEYSRKRQKMAEELAGKEAQEEEKMVVVEKVKPKVKKTALSFGSDVEDSESDEEERPRKGFGKNPTVDTSFLRDEERDRENEHKREELVEQYKLEQERLKTADFMVHFAYWDGSGHVRDVTIQQGDTVGKFVAVAKVALEADFPEIRHTHVDHLIYVKEDLMLPPHITWYEVIKDKVKGPNGLVLFPAKGEEPPEAAGRLYPAKLVERKWYERNKHIFPASRWELYDPARTGGGGVVTIKSTDC